MTPERAERRDEPGMASFYLQDNFGGKGPMAILLTERRWTTFLKMKSNFPALPFYSRPRRESEPDTHANGHPWAWLYKPEDSLKDERRWLSAGEYSEFEEALGAALHDASLRREAAKIEADAESEMVLA